MLRTAVVWVVLLGPILVLAADAVLWKVDAYCTITAVVRDWHRVSCWPRVIYVLAAAILYLHFFHDWPECFWED